LIEVDAFDVRVSGDYDPKRGTDATADVHQDVDVVELGAVDVEQGGHGGLGEARHGPVHDQVALWVLLHVLPRGDAVCALERQHGGV
jgi:hypothetical protein